MELGAKLVEGNLSLAPAALATRIHEKAEELRRPASRPAPWKSSGKPETANREMRTHATKKSRTG
jgi:hypothetical protein